MSARGNFRRTLERVEGLIDLHKSVSKKGKPTRECQDLLRATVVLSLSALDALVMDLIVERVPEASRRGALGQMVERWVKDEPATCLKMLAHSNPHLAVAEFVESQLSFTAFQRPAMIESHLKGILRIEFPWDIAGASMAPAISGAALKGHLEKLSDRRNLIAHKGDVRPGKRAPDPLTRRWVQDQVNYVRATGETLCGEVGRSLRHRGATGSVSRSTSVAEAIEAVSDEAGAA